MEMQKSLSIYLKDVRKYSKIKYTKKEEEKIIKKAKRGDSKSIDLLVKSNLLWVISMANKYKNLGVDYEDLISVGNQGLLKAIDKFNPKLNVKFYTYSTYWIKLFIINEINETSRTIRIPTHVFDTEKKLKLDEITKDDVKYINKKTISLDDENEHNIKLSDMLESTYSFFNDVTFEDGDIFSENNLLFKKLTNILDKKELYVIDNYFGFNNDKQSMKVIAKDLKLSEERTRQIYLSAIRKCRCYILESKKNNKDFDYEV
jgi:RNA polymerase primary sigma factor